MFVIYWVGRLLLGPPYTLQWQSGIWVQMVIFLESTFSVHVFSTQAQAWYYLHPPKQVCMDWNVE